MVTSTASLSSTRVSTQALRLLVLAIVLAVGTWLVRSDRLPLLADGEVYTLDLPAPLMSVDDAREVYDAGTHYFVDVRAADERAQAAGIPGAFTIAATTFDADLEDVLDFIYPEDQLILYGTDTPVPVGDVAARFLARGYEQLHILQGGLVAWRDSGGPLTEELDRE